MLCHYSYFSQQEDSLHIFIFQNIWIHFLVTIDELHQPLQLPNKLLAQLWVLNVTGEVNPVREETCFCTALDYIGSPQPHFTQVTEYSELEETHRDHQVQL